MCLSRLKEVILRYTTFGGELDFPRYLFRRGLAAIGGIFALRLTLVGPQIPETDMAIGVLTVLFVVSLALMFYFLRNTVQYTINEEIRKLRGTLATGITYLLLSGIVVIVLYPLLNILRTRPFSYTSTEIAAGLNIASYAALLTIIANRSSLKNQYPSLQTIKSRFTEETNQALDRIQTKIDGIGHIERPETDRATDRLSNGENVIVTGEGGVGKSGVLAGVTKEWEEDVLFIDSSTHSAVRNRVELSTGVGFKNGIQRPIKQLAVANHVLLIIDQLDDIDREAGNVYRDFILTVADFDNVTVAFACRDHDLTVRREYEPLDNAESFTTRLTIGLLRTTDAEKHVQNLIGESPSDELIQIGRKIENLDIIAQLAEDGVDFSGISGEISLWDKFREQLGREDHPDDGTRTGDDIIERLVEYAVDAIEDQSDGLNIFTVGTSQDWIDQRLINRGVIEESTDRPGNRKYRFRHLDFQRYLYAWNTVQDNRPIQEVTSQIDERLGKDIFRFMLVLYMQSDGDTTDQIGDIPVDSDTADHARQFLEEMLDDETGLGNYTAKTILDEIKTWDISGNDDFAGLILDNLQDRDTLYNYFFDSDTHKSWAEALHGRGDYTDPPNILIGYLRDIAPYHPEIVAEIIRDIQTDDRHSLGLVVTVIRELPFNVAANLVDVVQASVTQTPSDWHDTQATRLLQDLIEAGETSAGLDLLEALLQPRQPTDSEPNRAQPVTRLYSLESVLNEILETLVEAEGENVIDVLESRLREAVTIESEIQDKDIDAIVGPITTSIEGSDLPNQSPTDLKTLLIGTHRKALDQWFDQNPVDKSHHNLIERYLDDITLFRRLGLYVLKEHKDHYPSLVSAELLDASNYTEVWTKEDFLRLLRDGFTVLSEEDRLRVIEIITDVPTLDSIEEAAEQRSERFDDYTADELAEAEIARWARDRLWLIRDHLSDEYAQHLNQLIDEYGEPDEVLSLVKTSGGYVSQESPLPKEEISDMPPSDLIDYCIDEPFETTGWEEHESGPGGLSEVTPRGLAESAIPRILEEVTAFQDDIPRLQHAPSMYVSELLRGLQKQIDDNPDSIPPDFPWTPFLDLCEAVATTPEEWSESARMNVARLFREAYSTDTTESIHAYNDRVKQILFIQLEDPDPTDEREHPPQGYAGYNDPAHVAINSVRPLALGALLMYSSRLANQRGYEEYTEEEQSGFEPDVRERIETTMQKESRSTRATIGRWLNTIWSFDHELVLNNFDTLFPRNQTLRAKNMFSATWDAYLAYSRPYETLFDYLRPCYLHGIDMLVAGENTAIHGVERGLAVHLLNAYLNGYDERDDRQSLLSYLYDKEEPDLARQVAWQLWRWAEDTEEMRDNWDKVRMLWEQRITQVDDADAYAVEFQWFVEWLPLISERTAFKDIAPLIIDTAPFIARERRTWETVESYLEEYAEAHPSLVVEVYAALMNEETRPSWVSFTDTTAAILEPGLDEDPETRATALDIAEEYFSDGDDTAEQFLDNRT
ncbi:NACHT domain-containing protein [Halorubrum persicum]|uniref:ATP-binding protein n=1 Tax=Halorubrum persicum TaxID=1383844 RepID=UPI0015D4F47F|nr:ATP-binding protein [Halorubrum persicum]